MPDECGPALQNRPYWRSRGGGPWRIGVDVGDTFTDLVVADNAGALFTFKAPTDVLNPAAGVMHAVALAARSAGAAASATGGG